MNQYYLKGIEHCNKGEFTQAIDSFVLSLAQSGPHLEAYYNMGMAFYRLEDFDKCIENLDLALGLQADNAHIISQRGVAFFMKGDKSKALEELNRAQALEPENPYRYSSRAYIKNSLNDLEGAIADYKTAIKLDPEDSVALNNLGLLEEKAGYKGSAKKRFEKADAIADKGTTFEKPDVDSLIKEMKEKKAVHKKNYEEKIEKKDKPKPGFKDYLRVMKSVFTEKKTFEEFKDFVKGKLNRKNNGANG